jgi:protocatechuate 3,4-dioxygenase beta subunit
MKRRGITRRGFLGGTAGILLAACGSSKKAGHQDDSRAGSEGYIPGYEPTRASEPEAEPRPATMAAPTPACDVAETEDNILGPYYKAGAPERSVLAGPGVEGVRFVLIGRVMDTACKPLAGAVLDVWHADDDGEYDNEGFTFRGKLACDDAGAYRLETIVPGRYLNGPDYRPAHIHVRVRSGERVLLTTQLYFAGDPHNASDAFIRPSLIMPVSDRGGAKSATFDFVVRAA